MVMGLIVNLMTADIGAASPAWDRLGRMVPNRLESSVLLVPPHPRVHPFGCRANPPFPSPLARRYPPSGLAPPAVVADRERAGTRGGAELRHAPSWDWGIGRVRPSPPEEPH